MPAQHDSLPIGAPAATPGAASQAIPDAGARAPHARGRPGGVCAFRARIRQRLRVQAKGAAVCPPGQRDGRGT